MKYINTNEQVNETTNKLNELTIYTHTILNFDYMLEPLRYLFTS